MGGRMTEKTFLINLDDTKVCPHCSYIQGCMRCTAMETDFDLLTMKLVICACTGELRDRPERCPLKEQA